MRLFNTDIAVNVGGAVATGVTRGIGVGGAAVIAGAIEGKGVSIKAKI